MKYIGIDIGGMTIKAGVVLEDGTILCKKTVETDANQEDVKIVKDIANLIDGLLKENGIEKCEIAGVGIGSPGSVYDEKGIIRYSCNINFKNTHCIECWNNYICWYWNFEY